MQYTLFMYQKAKALFVMALNLVLPPRCIISGTEVDEHGMIASAAWSRLTFITPPLCVCCGDMFGFGGIQATEGLCDKCVANPPPFVSARAAIAYDGAGRDLILAFKHGDKTHAVATFIPWLLRMGAKALAEGHILIPVPLHPQRLLARRYNQAAIIADALAKTTGLVHCPCALIRTRATPSQGHKNASDRAVNVAGAFAVSPTAHKDVKGRTIILIDDVYTTGATVRACAQTLLDAGAEKIHVLTLARVIRI